MKVQRFLFVSLFVLSFLILAPVGLYAQAGYAYMSDPMFQRITAMPTPDADDTKRIRRALASIESGTLVFDQDTVYEVSETIDLKSYITLQGSTSNTLGGSYPESPSLIKYTGDGTLFKIDIDGFATSISFRDIGLKADSATATVGFEATGTANEALTFVEFRNVDFYNFHYGIKADDPGTTNWQFDNIKLDHCSFVVPETSSEEQTMANRHAAVYVDSGNSGWRVDGTTLQISKNSLGFNFNRVGYTVIDSLIGNGEVGALDPDPEIQDFAYAMIYVKNHGSLNIRNSVSEGVWYDLLVAPDAPVTFPINLLSNTFQDRVDVTGSTVTSIGNQYGLEQALVPDPELNVDGDWYSSPLPIARDNSYVYSMGDRFCTGAVVSRCDRKWTTAGTGSRNVTFGMFKNEFEAPSFIQNYSIANFPIDYTDGTTIGRPMFSILSPVGTTRPYLRMGFKDSTYDFYYDMQRNSSNGYLEFEGNQGGSNTGYSFNGPVKLPTYVQSGLPTPQGNGSLAYCSDCTVGSSPCAASGGGALALSISGSWVCK